MSPAQIILFIPRKIMQFFHRMLLGLKMAFYKKSYLNKTGYLHSKVNDSLRSSDGRYLPWMNYSIISFLDERLSKGLSVFEYGSGASTIYWSELTKHVVSIEYDAKWYEIVKGLISDKANAVVHLVEVGEDYYTAIGHLVPNTKYDVVVVDGRERVKCAKNALPYLSEQGIVMLDDSRRPHYQEAFDFYHNAGFKHLTFSGLKPTGFSIDTTTIFYRSENNCLEL